jgi:hypothetical protein
MKLFDAAEQSVPEDGVFGAGAHSDYGMLTLLKTDDVPGLQVSILTNSVTVSPHSFQFYLDNESPYESKLEDVQTSLSLASQTQNLEATVCLLKILGDTA